MSMKLLGKTKMIPILVSTLVILRRWEHLIPRGELLLLPSPRGELPLLPSPRPGRASRVRTPASQTPETVIRSLI